MTKRQKQKAARAINRCRNAVNDVLAALPPEERAREEQRDGLATLSDWLFNALSRFDAEPSMKETA